jgi:hypothetical protein
MLAEAPVASDRPPTVDWVNLPEGITTLSLWETLHDGVLLTVESDLLARTVTLRFEVDYVRKFHHLPEQTRFVITVSGVQSVRALRSVPWPGGCSIPQGLSRSEEERLMDEYQGKWRQESQSWTDFERLTDKGLEVSNSTLGRGSDAVALYLGLLDVDNSDSSPDAYIRGEGITFYVGERQVTPEEFVALGEAYWVAWEKRHKLD